VVSSVRRLRPSSFEKTVNDRVKLHHSPDFVDRAYLVFCETELRKLLTERVRYRRWFSECFTPLSRKRPPIGVRALITTGGCFRLGLTTFGNAFVASIASRCPIPVAMPEHLLCHSWTVPGHLGNRLEMLVHAEEMFRALGARSDSR